MSGLADNETEPNPCPYCGKVNDRFTGVGHANAPEAGDPTVCIGCGGVSVFDADRKQRKPTDAELFELCMSDAWPTIERARRAVMIHLHRRTF